MPIQYPDTINVPFRGKVFPCRLNHQVIYKAEAELGLNILYYQPPQLILQPAARQLACWVYILLLSTKIKNLTLAECVEETMGDNRARYQRIIASFVEQLAPVLHEFNGFEQSEVNGELVPLADPDSGESDGLLLESTSE